MECGPAAITTRLRRGYDAVTTRLRRDYEARYVYEAACRAFFRYVYDAPPGGPARYDYDQKELRCRS